MPRPGPGSPSATWRTSSWPRRRGATTSGRALLLAVKEAGDRAGGGPGLLAHPAVQRAGPLPLRPGRAAHVVRRLRDVGAACHSSSVGCRSCPASRPLGSRPRRGPAGRVRADHHAASPSHRDLQFRRRAPRVARGGRLLRPLRGAGAQRRRARQPARARRLVPVRRCPPHGRGGRRLGGPRRHLAAVLRRQAVRGGARPRGRARAPTSSTWRCCATSSPSASACSSRAAASPSTWPTSAASRTAAWPPTS